MPNSPVSRLFLAAAASMSLALPQIAHSQQTSLSLSEAVARAQVHAPALRGGDAGIRAADANLQAAALRPNPTLTMEAENVLGSGRYAGFGGGDKTYSLAIPLELGGKRAARVQVAEAERTHASASATVTRSELTLRTTLAFVALAASERRQVAAQAGRDLAERAAFAARERVRAGKASPIEEQRAEVMRVNANVKADRTNRAVGVAASALARLVGAAPPIFIAAPWFDGTGSAVAAVDAGKPAQLAVADAQVAAARARVDAARRARVPDVSVTAGMRKYGETRDSAAVLALSIPLPLFNQGSAEVARARAELDKAEAGREDVALDAEQALAHAQAAVADAQAAADAAAGPALAAASEAARIARIGYAEGKFTQLELIEAERTLAETRESSIDSLAALHEARARLAQLQGNTAPIYKD